MVRLGNMLDSLPIARPGLVFSELNVGDSSLQKENLVNAADFDRHFGDIWTIDIIA